MKATWAIAAVGLGLLGTVGSASAQRYEREYDRRESRGGGGGGDWDERMYLRCNPDVRRSVERGQTRSGLDHYRVFGRREGRALEC